MLTVSSTTLRALYVFTPLILTCEVGIIIIILILQTRKQRNSKFKDLAHDNTTSDLQSQDSYTGQCHGVGVASCYPPCPDSNPYGWVPLSSYSTLLLVPSVGDEAIAFACLHKSDSSPSFWAYLPVSQSPCMPRPHQSLVYVHLTLHKAKFLAFFLLPIKSSLYRERALLTSLLPTSLFLSPCLFPTNAYYSSDGICLFDRHCLPVSLGVQTLTCHCHTLSVQCHILHTVDA